MRFQEEMEVRQPTDQHPADEQAVHLLPDFFQAFEEVTTEAWGEENRRPALDGAGGKRSSAAVRMC
jgi:hypothetical protein